MMLSTQFEAAPPLLARAVRNAAPVLVLGAAAAGGAALAPAHGGPGPLFMAAIAAAALVSSIAGFAFSAICGAVLFHFWGDQVQVVQIMITCSIANQATMVWAVRHEIEQRLLGRFLVGGLAGLPLGVWALLHADHRVYTEALGTFLLGYGAYMLARRPSLLARQSPGFDMAAGFLGGITGGAAAFPGAPVTIWCGTKGWDKARQRALFQPFILLMQVAALLAISAAKPAAGHVVGHSAGFDPVILLCVPASLLGTWLGLACFRQLSTRQFTVAVNLLMLVSGLGYLL